jgi:AcrR family transcriptional regulator
MARIVNEAAYAARRNAILDAAQRAIATRGYEQMAIADLLSDLHISSGAFYHYFDSKPALLAALIERLGDQFEALVLPIIHDREASAIVKLQRFFAKIDQEKLVRKRFVLAYLRAWYSDENTLVRHKLYIARMQRFAPWLEEIIRQGVAEGTLTTPYPDQAARIVTSLFEDLALATAELLLKAEHPTDDLPRLERIIMASIDALERVLGAPAGCLQSISRAELEQWLAPLSSQEEPV